MGGGLYRTRQSTLSHYQSRGGWSPAIIPPVPHGDPQSIWHVTFQGSSHVYSHLLALSRLNLSMMPTDFAYGTFQLHGALALGESRASETWATRRLDGWSDLIAASPPSDSQQTTQDCCFSTPFWEKEVCRSKKTRFPILFVGKNGWGQKPFA